jgi:hypothetical protein
MSRFGKLFETPELPQSPGDEDIAPADAPTQTSKECDNATTQQVRVGEKVKVQTYDMMNIRVRKHLMG